MKNIHILPTDKPSRIYLIKSNNRLGITSNNPEFTENFGSGTQNQNIYITSDEEINQQTEPCWCINTIKNTWDKDLIYYQGAMPQYHFVGFKKIILTTDQDLIKDGVQTIDDEFLEWFVKNPSCEEVEVQKWFDGVDFLEYKIIIPKEEPKQKTLEEAAERYCLINNIPIDQMIVKNNRSCEFKTPITMFIEGAKWQQDKMYSEEEVITFGEFIFKHSLLTHTRGVKSLFKQFKKK